MSTVESGAATMKIMSSTSMTSMNGVTLISCSLGRRHRRRCRYERAMAHSAARRWAIGALAAVEVARTRRSTSAEASPTSAR